VQEALAALQPALPEAPASCNVSVLISGRNVQVTLRDTNEQRMLERLAAVLKAYPAPQATQSPAPSQGQEGYCGKHQVQMKLNEKNGQRWYSHRLPEGGYCKGR
jgi:hypothetical protein